MNPSSTPRNTDGTSVAASPAAMRRTAWARWVVVTQVQMAGTMTIPPGKRARRLSVGSLPSGAPACSE